MSEIRGAAFTCTMSDSAIYGEQYGPQEGNNGEIEETG